MTWILNTFLFNTGQYLLTLVSVVRTINRPATCGAIDFSLHCGNQI